MHLKTAQKVGKETSNFLAKMIFLLLFFDQAGLADSSPVDIKPPPAFLVPSSPGQNKPRSALFSVYSTKEGVELLQACPSAIIGCMKDALF